VSSSGRIANLKKLQINVAGTKLAANLGKQDGFIFKVGGKGFGAVGSNANPLRAAAQNS
jgi:hypothetical protein